MEKVTLQNIDDAVRSIDPKRFVSLLETFITAARHKEQGDALSEKRREALRKQNEQVYEKTLVAADQILTHSTIAVSHIINFHFQTGRGNRELSSDERTYYYFRKIRKHQIDLLLAIGNEVAILRDTMKHCRKIQRIFQQNAHPVAHASLFMSIVRERIDARPTTLLKLNGQGKKIEELNRTFSEIQTYEDTYHRNIRQEADLNPIGDAMEICGNLTAGTIDDMKHLKNRLKRDIREFAKGRKLMTKLATKGYSPLMKKSLDTLVESHIDRVRKFTEAICESRKNYYVEELG